MLAAWVGGSISNLPDPTELAGEAIASGRSHVSGRGLDEGISFFILCIELNTSQMLTISPKLWRECDISHMHGRTSARLFAASPPDFGAYFASNSGTPESPALAPAW
jgi:hypothetical protein